MSLREIAAADLKTIMEDQQGFLHSIQLTSPDKRIESFDGRSLDIGIAIDPETGLTISGRQSSISLSIASLAAKCFHLPEGICDSNLKPWLVKFKDLQGNDHSFKIKSTSPDRTLGCIVCHLEAFAS